jgi:TolB-like protein
VKKITGMIIFCLAAGLAYTQTVSLDNAIRSGAREIEERLAPGTKVIVVNFDSSSSRFSDNVIEKLTFDLVNGGKLTILDRKNLDRIREEEGFQYSGEVSDESMQRIGAKLGAQSLISGSGEDMGDHYLVRFRVISIETAAIQSLVLKNVEKDEQLNVLLTGARLGRGLALSKKKFVFGGRFGPGFGLTALESEFKKDYFEPDVQSETSFLISLYGTYNITSLFGLQMELNFMINNGVSIDGYDQLKLDETDDLGNYIYTEEECKINDKFTYSSLDIPILARFNFRPSSRLLISPFAGPYFSLPLGDLKNEYEYPDDPSANDSRDDKITSILISAMAGVDIGYNLGSGYITLDLRYRNDFAPLRADYWGERNVKLFARQTVNISLGYEIWF